MLHIESKESFDYVAHFIDSSTVFNSQYHDCRKKKKKLGADYNESNAVISSNHDLIEQILESVNLAGEGHIESTALSQSPQAENMIANKADTAIFCKTLGVIVNELQKRGSKCQLETYLICDAWYKREAGETFRFIAVGGERETCPIDPSKITYFYAKMQHLAHTHRDKKNILIHVWDDEKTLARLENFLENHSWSIPKNITLQMPQGKKIKGKDKINNFYEAVVRTFYRSSTIYKRILRADPDKLEHELALSYLALKSYHEQACKIGRNLKRYSHELKLEEYRNDEWELYFDILSLLYLEYSSETYRADYITNPVFLGQLFLYKPETINCFSTDAIIDVFNMAGRLSRSQLILILEYKIEHAKSSHEVHDVINTLCKEQHRSLVHNRTGRITLSILNSMWKGNRTSDTFDKFIVIAKCRLLLLRAKNNNHWELSTNQDVEFLGLHRHGGTHSRQAHSYRLFYRIKEPEVQQKVASKMKTYSDSIKSSYRNSR